MAKPIRMAGEKEEAQSRALANCSPLMLKPWICQEEEKS